MHIKLVSSRVPPKAEMLNIFEKWHVAFHGTRELAVRKILDTGDLLMPGEVSVHVPTFDSISLFSKQEGLYQDNDCDIMGTLLNNWHSASKT